MTAPSCSLSVVVNGDTMTFTYSPPDNVARTVWVDGKPTTIAPHDTATVPTADSYEYPTRGSWISVADTVAHCSVATTTTTSSTTTTQPAPSTTTTTEQSTTTTGPLSLVTIVRTTPEPTTTTALTSTPPTLPETGATSGDIVTAGLLAIGVGFIVAAAAERWLRRRR